MRRFQVNWRRTILAMAMLACGLFGLVLAAPRGPDVVAIAVDASGSVGDAYRNLLAPVVARALTALEGKDVCLTRFGAEQEVLHQGPLSAATAAELQRFLLESDTFPPELEGSPIVIEAARALTWLNQQKGSHKCLIMLTDGVDQPLLPGAVDAPKVNDVRALVVSTEMRLPRVGEVLRAAGADVRVVNDAVHAEPAVHALVTGVTPVVRAAQWLASLALLAGIVLTIGAIRRVESPARETSRPTPLQPLPDVPILSPPTVRLEAEIVGHPHLRATRRLQCGSGRLVVAREGASRADLHVPWQLLPHHATEVAVSLDPLALDQVRVTNGGIVPIVAGEVGLYEGQQAIISPSEAVRLGPRLTLALSLTIAEEARR
jgi:hypothetical protein